MKLSSLHELREVIDWVEKKYISHFNSGPHIKNYWMRVLASASGALCTHIFALVIGGLRYRGLGGFFCKSNSRSDSSTSRNLCNSIILGFDSRYCCVGFIYAVLL